MVLFGQVVIGPPGAGKTTYCYGMEQFLQTLGMTLIKEKQAYIHPSSCIYYLRLLLSMCACYHSGRRVAVVNMDFANDRVPYKAAIDVRELIDLDQIMEETQLGPNGGLLYCMETLLTNMGNIELRPSIIAYVSMYV